jgi:hypothetical protein
MSIRIDLHCHSDASNKTSEALLNAIRCPESYSRPSEVYEQAKRRGMNFVTLTDHDSIEGAQEIVNRGDVLVGEELTCWFPEDGCKLHVLVFGIAPEEHHSLQFRARNIYDVAEYIERNQLAHSVAHPIYRQNDKLERWHLERLLLLYKGFECLNGAHSPLHREAFEPLLDKLTRAQIARLSETHGLRPHWHEPHIKARTGGSDDHGLLNVGRTWTEFPTNTQSVDDLLDHLRNGRCSAGGEAGSSAKLAHTFYSVAVRYYSRHLLAPVSNPNFATKLLQMIAGERAAPTKSQMAQAALRSKLKSIGRSIISPLRRQRTDQSSSQGSGIIKRLFLASARDRIPQHADLLDAASKGLPPLGEHEQMFQFAQNINRDVVRGIADAINKSVDDASFTALFDSIAAILAQQFVMLPYYFAVFHQNKERHLLRQIIGQQTNHDAATLTVGLFVDTFDEINGVARFARDMSRQAQLAGRKLTIHTCSTSSVKSDLTRKNFAPLLSRPLPFYDQLPLHLPPVLEILEWSDRQQFDLIHVSTPGPMGLCGYLVSRMLRVPMLATYHTDFPAYAERLTGDHRVTRGTETYIRWFYQQAAAVFTRSSAYRFKLLDLGIDETRLRDIRPGVDLSNFGPHGRDQSVWTRLGVNQPRRLLYVGRVSLEKNLPLLIKTFERLCSIRDDVALIVAGDGPYLQTMRRELAEHPA